MSSNFVSSTHAVEVHMTEVVSSVDCSMEPVSFDGGLSLLKGHVSANMNGVSRSDIIPGKYEGGLKLWEGSLDLVRTLQSQVQNGHLLLTGKKILELGCGHGLPGIFCCIKGATLVHFQDFNSEVLQRLTIQNVKANLPSIKLQEEHSISKNAERDQIPKLRFIAGDWADVHHLLLNDKNVKNNLCGGYDIILMAETVYEITSFHSLYTLLKKCLSYPYGVVYLAAKKHYFGVGGGTRQFQALIEQDGTMRSTLIAEVVDGSSNVREVWKFSYPTECSSNKA